MSERKVMQNRKQFFRSKVISEVPQDCRKVQEQYSFWQGVCETREHKDGTECSGWDFWVFTCRRIVKFKYGMRSYSRTRVLESQRRNYYGSRDLIPILSLEEETGPGKQLWDHTLSWKKIISRSKRRGCNLLLLMQTHAVMKEIRSLWNG